MTHFSYFCVYIYYNILYVYMYLLLNCARRATPFHTCLLKSCNLILKMMGPRQGYFLSSMAIFGIYVQSQWVTPQKFNIKIKMATFKARVTGFPNHRCIILGIHVRAVIKTFKPDIPQNPGGLLNGDHYIYDIILIPIITGNLRYPPKATFPPINKALIRPY